MPVRSVVSRPTPLAIYWVSCALFGLSTSIFDALYALHLRALGLGEDQIGQIFAVGSVVMAGVLVAMVGGRFAGSAGLMFKLSSGLFAGCMLAFPLLTGFPAHLLVFALCSAGSAIMLSTGSAAMLEHVAPDRQRHFFNLYFIVFLSSSGCGTLIVTVVEYSSGLVRGIDLYTGYLLFAGLLSVAMALVRLPIGFRNHASESTAPGQSSAKNRDLIRQLRPHFVFTFMAAFFIGASAVLSIRFANLLFVERLHLDLMPALLLLSAERFICLAALLLLATRFKTGNLNVTSVVLLVLSGALLAAASIALMPLVFGLLYLARQAAHYSQQPLMEHVSFEGVPEAARAHAGFVRRLGLFLGTAAGGFVYGDLLAQGHAALAMLLAGAAALVAGGLYALREAGFFKPDRPPTAV